MVKTLTGKELEEYIEQNRGSYSDVYNNNWVMQYGSQKLYDKKHLYRWQKISKILHLKIPYKWRGHMIWLML